MKISLVYRWDNGYSYDHGMEGYNRHNRRKDRWMGESLFPATDGRIAAHDFIEHPGGNPSGTVEDEIAVFGGMTAVRVATGNLPYTFLGSPERQIAQMMKDDLYHYCLHGEDTVPTIEPRRRYEHPEDSLVEGIAETAANGNKRLARHITAWMQHGIRVVERRFSSTWQAMDIFDNIRYTFDHAVKEYKPQQFALHIDGSNIYLDVQKEFHLREERWPR